MSRKVKNQKSNLNYANVVVYLGVFVLLTVFPLYYHNYYFDILDSKYMFYYCTILIMAAIVLVIYTIPILWKNKENGLLDRWDKALKSIKLPDICMLLLILSATISTLQSDFKFEAFWGNEARFNGLFLWLIYGLAYLTITRLLKFRSQLLDYFLIVGVLVCLFGITDYFQMDLLGFKVRMRETQKSDFASTLGNINVYTAYVGMIVAVAMTLYTTSKSKVKTAFYYLVMMVSYVAIIMGKSDNGYLSIGIIFSVLPFYLFGTRAGIRRFFICIATLISSVWFVGLANKIWPDQVLFLDSVFGMMSRSNKLIYGVAGTWLLVAIVYVISKQMPEEKVGRIPLILWSSFIGICLLIGTYVLYDANIAGNGNRYGSLADYLVFSDSWGTDRGFVWKLSMNHFKEFSLFRKLFGYGPDTFGILTHYKDFDTMVEYNNTIFESAHNEYIHYLITIGLTGLVSYIALLCSSGFRIISKCKNDPYAMAIIFAVLAYATQATVSIAQPIVTPIMFTLLAIGLSACRCNDNN